MRVLVDTHILIWAALDAPQLSQKARKIILDPDNSLWVSPISYVEIAIKRSMGKSGLGCSVRDIADYVHDSGIGAVNLSPVHAAMLETLPWFHRDPFDRVLIAQALSEPLRLMTHDAVMAQYSNTVIEV